MEGLWIAISLEIAASTWPMKLVGLPPCGVFGQPFFIWSTDLVLSWKLLKSTEKLENFKSMHNAPTLLQRQCCPFPNPVSFSPRTEDWLAFPRLPEVQWDRAIKLQPRTGVRRWWAAPPDLHCSPPPVLSLLFAGQRRRLPRGLLGLCGQWCHVMEEARISTQLKRSKAPNTCPTTTTLTWTGWQQGEK